MGLPSSVLSDELPAPITGSLNGQAYEWFILSDESDSSASFVELGDELKIDITGSLDEERWDTNEALSISLTLQGDMLTKADVVYLIGDTPLPPLYTSENSEVMVTLLQVEHHRQTVHVTGSIQGVLALQVAMAEPPDREEGISINVRFDVIAKKIEF